MSLRQSLSEALTVLGKDADEVAGRLQAMGFTGRPSLPRECPVARYLRESLHRRVAVGGTFCVTGAGDVPLPPPVMDFVARFDAGGYPGLVDDAPHEAGCPAERDDCICER